MVCIDDECMQRGYVEKPRRRITVGSGRALGGLWASSVPSVALCRRSPCAVGRPVPSVALCRRSPCAVGRPVPSVALCRRSPCAVGRTVPLAVLCCWPSCAVGRPVPLTVLCRRAPCNAQVDPRSSFER